MKLAEERSRIAEEKAKKVAAEREAQLKREAEEKVARIAAEEAAHAERIRVSDAAAQKEKAQIAE